MSRNYADPNMIHPAVKAYRDKFHKCPNAGLRRDIVITVQDLGLWLKILNGWRYQIQDRWKAKNPLAVKAMLDEYDRLSYDRESIQATNGNGKASTLSACDREGISERGRGYVSKVPSEAERDYFGVGAVDVNRISAVSHVRNKNHD